MPDKKKNEKPTYPTPRLSWVSLTDDQLTPEDGEPLYLVCAQRLRLAASRFAARRGEKEYSNSVYVPLQYVTATPGQVFGASAMIAKPKDGEAVSKAARDEAAARIAELLKDEAIVQIGVIDATPVRWFGVLSPEGLRIVEDFDSYALAQLVTNPHAKSGAEIDPAGEAVYLVSEGQSLYLEGKTFTHPSLVSASAFDEGYRYREADRADAIAQKVAAGIVIEAGKVRPVTTAKPNLLTGKQPRFELELKKEIAAEMDALAEEDYWRREAEWAARGRPGYEPVNLSRY